MAAGRKLRLFSYSLRLSTSHWAPWSRANCIDIIDIDYRYHLFE